MSRTFGDTTTNLSGIIEHFRKVADTIDDIREFSYEEVYTTEGSNHNYPLMRVFPDKPDNISFMADISATQEWRTYNFFISILDMYQNKEKTQVDKSAKYDYLEALFQEFVFKTFAEAYKVKFQPVMAAQKPTILKPANQGNDMAAEILVRIGVKIYAGDSNFYKFEY